MPVEPTETEHAPTLGASHVVGRYRYELATQRWWWSDETYQIHGFRPGDVLPTTALVLAHEHPDDRERVSGVLEDAALTGEPFSSVHRIMDARGQERTLSVVGQGRRDPRTTRVSELVGYFVDITSTVKAQAGEAASKSIRASAVTRAPIEQAKGVVAFVLGVDADEAFERLRTTSNDTNVTIRDVAQRIIELGSTKNPAANVLAALNPPAANAPVPGPATATGTAAAR